MDIGSMMSAVQQQDAKRVASGLAVNRGNGLTTAATATTGAGSRLAAAAATGKAATSSSSTADSADITSSDFLTLLVTEMQNQDPTQPTDPNQYIQQLVGVNSLQQLIAINQDLTPTTTTSTGSGLAGSLGNGGNVASGSAGPHGSTPASSTPNNSTHNSLSSTDGGSSLAVPAKGVAQ